MAKDLSQTKWHGVPRKEIPWAPTVDFDACIGCELCFVTCGREVFEIDLNEDKYRKAKVERPYNCMVGCSTCAVVCPTEAIAFSSRDIVWKVEREFKIFKTVRAEAREKRERAEALGARARAQEDVDKTQTRAQVRIAGIFGEKRFLVKLQEMVRDRPYDIENLQFNVPTLKGLMEDTPAHMSLEATSTVQEDVHPFVDELRKLVSENELVWIEEK